MATRGKWLSASAIGLMTAGWFVAQLLLARHAQTVMFQDEVRNYHTFLAMHPTLPPLPPTPVHARWWLLPATESAVALVACTVVAGAVALGGRRAWAVLPAVLPLTLLLGVGDGNSLGLGWVQPFQHMYAWLRAGAVVDALVVTAIALSLMRLLPSRRATTPIGPAVLRTLPIAIIAFGYWLVGHPMPDDHDRIFVTRTLLLVLMAAVVSTAQLPILLRMAVLFVLPFADPTMAQGLIEGNAHWSTYLHHVAVGLAALVYVLGAPRAVRAMSRNSSGPSRPMPAGSTPSSGAPA